jgi:hypothetical protein
VPLVAGLAFATRRLINALSSYLLLAFPSGRLGLKRSAGHGGQILLSEATRRRIEPRLPPDATVQRLGAFSLKGLSGLESISQLTVPDLPAVFPPLRLETPVRVTD